MVTDGVVVRRSASDLTIVGRPRAVPIAIMTGVCVVFAAGLPSASGYFRVLVPAGLALGFLQVVTRAQTRLVFESSGFVLAGWEGVRRYRLAGKFADLDVIGVSAMLPDLERMPRKDPGFFLQLAVAGRTYRVFRGLERSELEDITAQLVEWKTRCAV